MLFSWYFIYIAELISKWKTVAIKNNEPRVDAKSVCGVASATIYQWRIYHNPDIWTSSLCEWPSGDSTPTRDKILWGTENNSED